MFLMVLKGVCNEICYYEVGREGKGYKSCLLWSVSLVFGIKLEMMENFEKQRRECYIFLQIDSYSGVL